MAGPKIPPNPEAGMPVSASEEGMVRDALRGIYRSIPGLGMIDANGFATHAPATAPQIIPAAIIKGAGSDKERHGWEEVVVAPNFKGDASNPPGMKQYPTGKAPRAGGPDCGFAIHPAGVKDIPADCFFCSLLPVPDNKYGMIYIMLNLPIMFPVITTNGTGSDGDNSTAPSYTYTCKTLWGKIIQSNVAPHRMYPVGSWDRPAANDGTENDKGIGMLTEVGFQLWAAADMYDAEVC